MKFARARSGNANNAKFCSCVYIIESIVIPRFYADVGRTSTSFKNRVKSRVADLEAKFNMLGCGTCHYCARECVSVHTEAFLN